MKKHSDLRLIRLETKLAAAHMPQRLTVTVPDPSSQGGFAFSVQSKLLELLADKCMVAMESFYMNNIIGTLGSDIPLVSAPAYPGFFTTGTALQGISSINIEMPDLQCARAFDTYTGKYDFRVATVPTPPVYQRAAPPQEIQFNWGVVNQQIGFPVLNKNFLNNNQLNFRITTNYGGAANLFPPLASQGTTVPYNLLPNLGTNGNPVNYSTSSVQSCTIQNGGTYASGPPTVTFSNPATGGIKATGTPVMSGGPLGTGSVIGILISNPGYGYTSPPTITFSPASTTAATAVLNAGGNPLYNNSPPVYQQAPTCRFTLIFYPYFDVSEKNDEQY
jgi:hypothetical protein